MGKVPMIAIAAVAVVALAAGALLLMSGRPETAGGNVLLSDIQGDSPRSLRDVMAMAANQTCTFSDEEGSQGVVYVAGGKMRGDFSTTANGQQINSHMISDGEYAHMWMDGEQNGYKISLQQMERFSDLAEDGQSSMDLDAPADFTCSHWSQDNSKFVLPAIEFVDIGAMFGELENMMPASADNAGELQVMQCASCNSLPLEAAAQCRQALGC